MQWNTQHTILKRSVIFLVLILLPISNSSRILGYFPAPTKSHLLIHCAIANILAQEGHDVTVLVNAPNVYKNANYKYIQIHDLNYDEIAPKEQQQSIFNRIGEIFNQFNDVLSLLHPKMQHFLQTHQAGSFDLLILRYYMNEFHLGLAAHFQCPVIISMSVQSTPSTNLLIGNPRETAYVPSVFLRYKQPMSFFQRVINGLIFCFENAFGLVFDYYQNKYYKLNFPPSRYLPFELARQNVSLVFSNHHFTQGPIRPNVPALIEIGGIQINDTQDALPTDIAGILNNSTKGVVYISFGTKIKPSAISEDKKKIMFDVFSKLPYTFLWKYDNSEIPGEAKNIYYRKWLPQNNLLSHPHIKLFITHGGQGSIVEAQYHGVPMVAIPFMSDQPFNVKIMENSKFGLGYEYASMTETSFRKIILEVLENPKYVENVKHFAKVYKDRPMTSKELVLYWVNYVLRYEGAYHLKSPAVLLNNWQLMSLDVLAFLLSILIIVVFVSNHIFKMLYHCIFKRSSNNHIYTLRKIKKKIQ